MITDGKGRMPKFGGKLTPEEIDTLVQEIRRTEQEIEGLPYAARRGICGFVGRPENGGDILNSGEETEKRFLVGVIDQRFEKNFLITSVDYVFNWARKSSLWPLTFGLACCAIEMIASTTARFDMARFGAEVFRPSPRQADLMIVSGTVTLKMAQVIQRVWQQMPDPKWCISMGACSSVGGPFNAYSVLQGVDRIIPVDVYVVGCPPRPEALFYALLKLQDRIDTMTLAKRPTEVRLRTEMVEEFKRNVMVAQVPEPCREVTHTDTAQETRRKWRS